MMSSHKPHNFTLTICCIFALCLIPGTFVSHASAAESILIDSEFEEYRFYTPLELGGTSNNVMCKDGIRTKLACFERDGWFPYGQGSSPTEASSVQLLPGEGAARMTLPAGGDPINSFVSLSQQRRLARNDLYRFVVFIRSSEINQNERPYVSTFCDRPEAVTTLSDDKSETNVENPVYQGLDTFINKSGNWRRISFLVAGDGKTWICSFRLLGQPGALNGAATSIDVDSMSITRVGRRPKGSIPESSLRTDTSGNFEFSTSELENNNWMVKRLGPQTSTYEIERRKGSRQLVLGLPNGNDSQSITVSRTLELEQYGRYTLCGTVSNVSGEFKVIANFLVKKQLGIPGNSSGFVTGPVDVHLNADATKRFEVNFVAPYPNRNNKYELVMRALGYGNNSKNPVTVAYDNVKVVQASKGCS